MSLDDGYQTAYSESEDFDSFSDEICRYCLGPVTADCSFKPCRCNSSIHRVCLDEWLKRSNTKCEICQTEYIVETQTRFSFKWLYNIRFYLILLAAFYIPPFIGLYGDYFISSQEYICLNDSLYQIVVTFTFETQLGIFITLANYTIISLLICLGQYHGKEFWRMCLCAIFILHIASWTIGTVLVDRLPLSNPCLPYGQLELDRLIWLKSFPFNIVIWSLGFNCISFAFIACGLVFSILFGVIWLIIQVVKGIRNYKRWCCFEERYVIQNLA
jgi:hypothetical protein